MFASWSRITSPNVLFKSENALKWNSLLFADEDNVIPTEDENDGVWRKFLRLFGRDVTEKA